MYWEFNHFVKDEIVNENTESDVFCWSASLSFEKKRSSPANFCHIKETSFLIKLDLNVSLEAWLWLRVSNTLVKLNNWHEVGFELKIVSVSMNRGCSLEPARFLLVQRDIQVCYWIWNWVIIFNRVAVGMF